MRRWAITVLILLVGFVYLNNSSFLVSHDGKGPFLLAHRGLAQTFSMDGITAQTNTAEQIDEGARVWAPCHPSTN